MQSVFLVKGRIYRDRNLPKFQSAGAVPRPPDRTGSILGLEIYFNIYHPSSCLPRASHFTTSDTEHASPTFPPCSLLPSKEDQNLFKAMPCAHAQIPFLPPFLWVVLLQGLPPPHFSSGFHPLYQPPHAPGSLS